MKLPRRPYATGSGDQTTEQTDDWYCLLCARTLAATQRSRAADNRDELAPLHVWMAPAWQEIISRAAQKSLAVMCPAC